MVYDLTKNNNRGNVSSETIKLAIAYMKRTTDSIRKTGTAKEKVDHDITVGYQLCSVMVRRVFTEDQEAKLTNYLRHACAIYFVSIRPHPKTGPRIETHAKRKKQKATVWTHMPEENLVGRQEQWGKDGKEWECRPCNAYHATLVFNVSSR